MLTEGSPSRESLSRLIILSSRRIPFFPFFLLFFTLFNTIFDVPQSVSNLTYGLASATLVLASSAYATFGDGFYDHLDQE